MPTDYGYFYIERNSPHSRESAKVIRDLEDKGNENTNPELNTNLKEKYIFAFAEALNNEEVHLSQHLQNAYISNADDENEEVDDIKRL